MPNKPNPNPPLERPTHSIPRATPLVSLKGEAEFRRVSSGDTVRTSFFTLRRLPYRPLFGKPWRPSAVVGIVASKKSVGNAVKRNRARRRVREALRLVQPEACRGLLLLNPSVLTADFAELKAALELAFSRPIKTLKNKNPRNPSNPSSSSNTPSSAPNKPTPNKLTSNKQGSKK
jgi:ribonuclease P protein component